MAQRIIVVYWQQDQLIRQLQEQHYEQYMAQVYTQEAQAQAASIAAQQQSQAGGGHRHSMGGAGEAIGLHQRGSLVIGAAAKQQYRDPRRRRRQRGQQSPRAGSGGGENDDEESSSSSDSSEGVKPADAYLQQVWLVKHTRIECRSSIRSISDFLYSESLTGT